MATLKLMGAGPHHDVAINANKITIGTITVDAEEHQADGLVNVDVYVKKDGSYSLKGTGAFAANIAIPGRRYREVAGTDTEGKPTIDHVPEALDPNAVEVSLWPKQ